MAESAVTYVVDKVLRLLEEEAQLLKGVKEEVQGIAGELEQIKAVLRDADAMEEESQEIQVWVKQVRDVAHDFEDALDEFRLHSTHTDITSPIKKLKARHQIASEIQSIKSRFSTISEGHQRLQQRETTAVDQANSSTNTTGNKRWLERRQDALLLEEADLVGIDKPKKELIRWIVQADSGRQVVSVVGMGGLGKTTLVKKVYDDAQVKLHFKYHAWLTVNQSFKTEELLKDMVRQLHEVKKKKVPEGVESMSKDKLITMIKNFLQQKRYLIVLDDVWNIADWDAVKFAFPNNISSRVMLTTRNSEVATTSCKEFQGNYVYHLNPLSAEESWTLFCRKTFGGENFFPQHLKGLTKRILAKCEGLPLAIVAISGVLATKERIDDWEMVSRSLGAELDDNVVLNSLKKILSLSYHDLPYYIKSCFLYLSIFPQKNLIDQMRLIRLWIAEGFVKEKEGKTLEEVAEGYLYELLNRSLIQVAETTSEGRIKTCRIHDLLREIIISKSRDQNFVTIARGQNIIWPEKVRRLSIQNSKEDVQVPHSQSISRLRSLLVFRKVDLPSDSSKYVLFSLDFKLLNVLDMQGAPLETFPNEVLKLFHLKYLSLRSTKINSIPSSIGKLENLETLDLKHSFVTTLPVEISQLQKLRHLLVYRYEIQSYAHIHSRYGFTTAAHAIGSLRCLQKLGFVEANHGGNETMRELGKLNQLRRLVIVKFRREYGVALSSSIEKLKNLRALSITSIEENEIIDLDTISSPPQFLQRIYLTGRLEKLPHWISSLHHLAKVSLKWSNLRDDPLVTLQDLPNLVHLEFLQVYEGDTLHFKAQGFQSLKVLSLDKLDELETVTVEEGAMPRLEKLILQRCKLLHKLPSGIEHLSNLKLLEFFDMPDELITTLRPDKEGGDYWKVKNVPEINSTYWRDGGWDVFSLDRSVEGEALPLTRSYQLPPCWK